MDIDLVVELEHWKEDGHYDRLGLDEQTISILGVSVPGDRYIARCWYSRSVSRTAARTRLDWRLFVLFYEIVVFLTGRRIEQGFTDEIQPAHLFVSPVLFLLGILVGMVDLCDFFECVFDCHTACVTPNTKLGTLCIKEAIAVF